MSINETVPERDTVVLEALCELFKDKPEGVSMIVIARKAGLSLPEATRSLEFLRRSGMVESVSRGFIPSEDGLNHGAAKLAKG